MGQGVSFGTNIFSLIAQRQLADASSQMSGALERLSTGLRINHASDDAASLSIASHLSLKSRIYTQGIRNVNDSISLLNIAQGAVQSYGTIVTRIRELAAQSANGIYTSRQLSSLNDEANALIDEYNRIARSTSFNSLKLLDGSLGNLVTQAGNSTLAVRTGQNLAIGVVGNGTYTDLGYGYVNSAISNVVSADIDGDGKADAVEIGQSEVRVTLSNGNGQFTLVASLAGYDNQGNEHPPNFTKVAVADVNGDGKYDIVALGDELVSSSSSNYQAVVQTFLGDGTGQFSYSSSFVPYTVGLADTAVSDFFTLGDINGDGRVDIVAHMRNNDAAVAGIYAGLGNGDGTFGASTQKVSLSIGTDEYNGVLRDVNGDGRLDLITNATGGVNVRLNNGSGGFGSASGYSAGTTLSVGDFNNDGYNDIVSGSGSSVYILKNNGNGTFTALSSVSNAAASETLATLGDLNNDGNLDIVTSDGVFLGSGNGSFSYKGSHTASNSLALGDADGDGVLDILSINTSDGRLHDQQGGTDASYTISHVDLTTRAGALAALTLFETYQDNIGKELGSLGSSQSRFSVALSALQETKLNYDSAYSVLMNADVAAETANLIKSQILQQVASSVLAQANVAPEIGIKLLKN